MVVPKYGAMNIKLFSNKQLRQLETLQEANLNRNLINLQKNFYRNTHNKIENRRKIKLKKKTNKQIFIQIEHRNELLISLD